MTTLQLNHRLQTRRNAKKKGIKLEKETVLDAKNGESSLLSKAMVKKKKLMEAPLKKEKMQKELEDAMLLNDTQFTRFDELLTQTQMRSVLA